MGKLATAADPLGNVVSFEYDAADREIKRINARGFETDLSYDVAGRLATLTDALGHVTDFEYDRVGNVTRITNALGRVTEFDYDNRGQRSATRSPFDLLNGTQTSFTHDPRGNLLTASEPHPLGSAVSIQIWTDTDVLTSWSDPTGVTTAFTYDDVDQVDMRTQVERDLSTDHDWDLAGRLTNITVSTTAEGVVSTASAAYDASGNTTSVTDPNGNLLEFEYDALDRVTLERDAENNTAAYVYEARGLLALRSNARNLSLPPPLPPTSSVAWSYDTAGRRIQTIGFEATYSWTIDEDLDENGNSRSSTASSTDPARGPATVLRSFDALDRQTSRTVEFAPGVQRTVASEYDALGNLSALVYSDGTTRVDYAYDELNRITSATYLGAGPAQLTTYEYDIAGNLIGVVRPDGSETINTYDLAARPLTIDDQVNGSIVFAANFVLDSAKRRVSADIVSPLEPTVGVDESFVYDAANRLVTRNGSESLSYDADGNLVSGRIGGQARSLGYNARNQLVDFDSDIYRYDADGNRGARTSGGVTTYYLYDNLGRMIEELDGTGAVIARYVHGVGLISREAGATTSVYHYDSRGSTVALTDLAGMITDRYAYTPFGDVQRDAANTTPNPFTYNGRDGVFDEDNGLYAMQSRHYAPELMRFIQKDPVYSGRIDRPQSLNRYAFVEGNPIELIDPTGEAAFSTVNSDPRDRIGTPRATRAALESTGEPPKPPCTDPESDECGPVQDVAASVTTKLAKEAGKEIGGNLLSKDGFTAQQVGNACDEIGGGVCDAITSAERFVVDVFEKNLYPIYDAYTERVLDAVNTATEPFCSQVPDFFCGGIGDAYGWARSFMLDGHQEFFESGWTGFLAGEIDVLVGVTETTAGFAEDLGDVFIDGVNGIDDLISDFGGYIGSIF